MATTDPQSGDLATTLFTQRHTHLEKTLVEAKLSALALNPGPSLTYLTGMHFHLMERPVVALFALGQPLTLVLPELEIAKTKGLPYPIQTFPYGEDPGKWSGVFQQAAWETGIDQGEIGIEPGRLRVLELRFLEKAAPEAEFVAAEGVLEALRMRKDQLELSAMREAVQIAQRALEATLPMIQAGATERQVAAELTMQLLRAGSESPFPFSPIVSGGPNSANPHATPSDRPLRPGDLLVIDWGATHKGYVSDITRTFAIGEADDELVQIARIVEEANAAGRAAARPGVTAQGVDRAARKVIQDSGYGEYFIHRTGHGLGMEAHEAPFIRDGNPLLLETGMTFTIEPGIYLPGRGGVRIEDDVVITENGCESLTGLPRKLRSL